MAETLQNVVAVKDDSNGNGTSASNPDPINALIESLGLNGFTKTTLDHNRFTSLGVMLAIALVGIVKKYQPTGDDPIYPPGKATAAMIQQEVDAKVADFQNQINQSKQDVANMQVQVEIAQAKIEQQKQEIGAVISAVAAVGAPFAGPFAPVVLGAAGLITAGLGADTLRKSSQAQQSSNTANAQAGSTQGNTPTATAGDSGAGGNQSDSLVTSVQEFAEAIAAAINKSKS